MTNQFDALFRSISKKRDRQAAMLLHTESQLQALAELTSSQPSQAPKPSKV